MRLFLKVLLALIALGVFAAAFVLVPAHWTVRSVEPALPTLAQLRDLRSVENGPVSVRYINTSTQSLPGGDLGHTVFLAEWANGDLLMIDAGMDRETALAFGELMKTALGAGEAEPHGNIAQLLGDQLQRVAAVAFTHLHIDHSQGVLPFCEARGEGALLLQTSYQADLPIVNTTEGGEIVANSCLQRGELAGDTLLTASRFPGVALVALGGHTPGSTLFAIAGPDRLWIFSGDITNTKAEITNDLSKAFIYSYFLVPENTSRTRELRAWLAELDRNDDVSVVVSHDLGDVVSSGLPEFER